MLTFEDVFSEDSHEPGLIHLDIIATSQGHLRDEEVIFVHSPMLNSLKFNTPERHASKTCNSGDRTVVDRETSELEVLPGSSVQQAFRGGSAYCKQGDHPL